MKRKAREIGAAVAAMLAVCNLAAQGQNLIAWGDNYFGQTDVPASATNVVAIAAGSDHSLALRDDFTVVAWGNNSYGQTDVPPAAYNVMAIAAGYAHNLALRTDGTVVAWGDNSSGQTNVPASTTNVVAIAACSNHSLALQANGTVVSWGSSTFGDDLPRDNVALAAGAIHSLVLRADGSVAVWGDNLWGKTSVPGSATNVVAIAAGDDHSLALRINGTVIAWGSYLNGRTNVPALATNGVAVAAAFDRSLVLRADGTVVEWGGLTNTLLSLTNVTAIAAGRQHSLALVGNASPTILASGRSKTVIAGTPLPLFVRAVGVQPLSYSWLANGFPIPDADTNYPSIPAVPGTDDVAYQAVVSNVVGCVTSAVVKVAVRPVGAWGDNLVGQCDIPLAVTNPVAISVGAFHSLALNADGSIVAWGKNWDGQTDVPHTATNVVAVAAGSDHSLALKDDGSVIAWGRNWGGQTNVPPSATNAVAIGAGWAHSLALRADGTVVAWGNDTYAQSEVSFLATEVTAIAAGYFHNLALRADGSVVAWGDNTFGQATIPSSATNVVAIAAGAFHSLALRADGSVFAWGDNSFGQAAVPASATNVVAVSAGWYHSVATRADGTTVTWGKSCLGVTNTPAGLHDVVGAAAGEDYSLAMVESGAARFGRALTSVVGHAGSQALLRAAVVGTYPMAFQWFHDGVAIADATNRDLLLASAQLADAGNYALVVSNILGQTTSSPISLTVRSDPVTVTAVGAWGDNFHGQCNVPPSLMNPRAIAAGAYHALALQEDGSVIAWGRTVYGSTNTQLNLPYGPTPLDQTNVPPAATNIVAIAAGRDHSLALRTDGQVVAWGGNSDGQASVPAAATNIVSISAGSLHSLALRGDGTVIAWGNNDERQTNVQVFLRNVIAVSAGYFHNLAICSDRTVVAWGSVYQVPSSVTNVVAIAAGWEHSLALREDGSVVAWGDNSYGQATVPETATNVIALTAGYGLSLALRLDGTVVAWGKTNFAATIVPSGLRNVAAIAAGEDYCLAMVELGPPRFEQPPASTVISIGGQVLLTAGVQGTYPFAGQWFHDGVPIPGATNPRLLLPSAQTNDAGTYTFTTTNGIGQSGASANLTVLSSPLITTLAAQQNALVGRPLGLTVTALGSPPLTYQWQLNGVDLADGGRISGANSPTLSFNTAQYEDAGDYSVVVGNEYGSASGLIAQLAVTPIVGWGDNSAGQLLVPREATNVLAIASGGDHNLALRADGTVVAWGDNSSSQCTVPTSASNVIAIAAGASHSLAALASGKVIAWGDNTFGQTNVPALATNAVIVAGGGAHSLAALATGYGRGWGSSLAQPSSFPLSDIAAIAAGGVHNVAVSVDGYVSAWGANWSGQTTVPGSAIPATAVAAGDRCSLALRADGTIVGWGRSAYGQTLAPASATNVVSITAGDDHGVALRADGSTIAWGDNSFGQTNVPPTAANAVAVTAGSAHSLALLTSAQQCDQTVTLGEHSLFSAASLGWGRASYQWQFNGMTIPGATSLGLAVGSAHWTNAGVYRVVASNALGSVTGPTITLTAVRTPLRFDQPLERQYETNSELHLHLLGAAGVGPVVVYASSDLIAWEPVFTNPPVIGSLDFIDPAITSLGWRFFRAAEIVVPGPLRLETVAPSLPTAVGAFPLRLTGLSALGPVTIYASTNLVDWEPIFVNPPTIGPLDYWDWPAPGQSPRFYRAAETR